MYMILSSRNILFRVGTILSVAILIFFAISTIITISLYNDLVSEAAHRSKGLAQTLLAHIFQPYPYTAFISMIIALLYATVVTVLIYLFFEKTQSPEMLFFFLFAFSFAFEGLRAIIPIARLYNMPNMILIIAARILLFGRYFGLFSLFAASIYASGFEIQKQGLSIFIIAIVSLIISLGIPIDGLAWDTSLTMLSGYPFMFLMLEVGIVLITMTNFFVAAHSKGSQEYIFSAIGASLAILGKHILITADVWPACLLGLGILTGGTWLLCSRLHRFYLWL